MDEPEKGRKNTAISRDTEVRGSRTEQTERGEPDYVPEEYVSEEDVSEEDDIDRLSDR